MELNYQDFSCGFTAGEGMFIATAETPFEEICNWVSTGKVLWFYDGDKYRVVINFEASENYAVLYFFDDYGMISTQRYGGDS